MIEVTKGDTKSITVILKSSGVKVPFEVGDIITFTVKKRIGQLTNDIQKIVSTFTNGEAIINLTTTDTNIAIGTYQYDIQYDKENGERYTIIKGRFVVGVGVTL
jgi:predicted nucleic acid-binding protein